MDSVKFGKNLSSLRRREGLTQEALGEKIGVTNKTVSRWENGNNLPDIEMLQVLGDTFHVSVDQLISGGEQKCQEPPCPLTGKKKEDRFSHDEKYAYWKKKWLQEHIVGIILVYILLTLLFVLAIVRKKALLAAISPMLSGALYAYFRNQMMIYIEDRIFEK